MAKNSGSTIADNRKARHDYFVHETYETGIVLVGTEVKSIRQGKVNLKDGFARVSKGELWLQNVHISPYEQGNRFNVDPLRNRKLLMHKREIHRLMGQVQQKGYTLVPLSMYWSHGKVKVALGLCTGKKNYDKRKDMAAKSAKREMDRALRAKNA